MNIVNAKRNINDMVLLMDDRMTSFMNRLHPIVMWIIIIIAFVFIVVWFPSFLMIRGAAYVERHGKNNFRQDKINIFKFDSSATIFGNASFIIGIQMGNVMKSYGFKPKKLNSSQRVKIADSYNEQIKIYEKFYPEILEELRGIAYVLNMNFKNLACELICFNGKTSGCSIFSVDGMIGRNYDWNVDAVDFIDVFTIDGKILGISDGYLINNYKRSDSYIMGADYINVHGLYVGITYAYSKSQNYGLNYSHYIRKIAETCKNVADVIELIKTLPLCEAKNIFVMDKDGKAIVIEHNSGLEYVIQETDLVKTNFFIDKTFAKKYDEAFNKWSKESVMSSYNKIHSLIDENKPKNLHDIKTILDADGVYADKKTVYQLTIDAKNVLLYHKNIEYNLKQYLK